MKSKDITHEHVKAACDVAKKVGFGIATNLEGRGRVDIGYLRYIPQAELWFEKELPFGKRAVGRRFRREVSVFEYQALFVALKHLKLPYDRHLGYIDFRPDLDDPAIYERRLRNLLLNVRKLIRENPSLFPSDAGYFIEGIRRTNDLTAYMVLSDWLEENNLDEFAKNIRVAIELLEVMI